MYFNLFLRHLHSLALLSMSFNVIFYFSFSNTVSLRTHKISQKISQYLEELASKCIIYPPKASSTHTHTHTHTHKKVNASVKQEEVKRVL